jgi:hypothetical protein
MSEILDVNANYEQLYKAMLRRSGGGRLLDCGRASGSITIPPGPADVPNGFSSTGNSASLCKFECRAEFAEMVSIYVQPALALNFTPVPGPPTPLLARPSVTIRFGSGGSQQSIDIDLNQGVFLNAVGSYIEVIGNNDPLPLLINANPVTPRPVIIGCSVGYSSLSRTVPLTRTLYSDVIPGPGIVNYLVPPGGKTVTIGRWIAGGIASIDQLDEMGTAITRDIVAAGAPCPVIQLSGDCRVVQVTFAGSTIARAIFGIAL